MRAGAPFFDDARHVSPARTGPDVPARLEWARATGGLPARGER